RALVAVVDDDGDAVVVLLGRWLFRREQDRDDDPQDHRTGIIEGSDAALAHRQALLALAGARFGGAGLQLGLHRRLQVVLALADLLEDARLLDLALEALDRPIDCLSVANRHLGQSRLPRSSKAPRRYKARRTMSTQH